MRVTDLFHKGAGFVAARAQRRVDHEQGDVLTDELLQRDYELGRPLIAGQTGHPLICREVEGGVEVHEAVHAGDVRPREKPPAERKRLGNALGPQRRSIAGVEHDGDAVDTCLRKLTAQQLVPPA